MPEWMNMANELGPEKTVQVYDPKTGMKGVVVIDCTALGMTAGGGIRMLPDITTREIFQLARAMTYKFGTLGVPIGGGEIRDMGGSHGERGREKEHHAGLWPCREAVDPGWVGLWC